MVDTVRFVSDGEELVLSHAGPTRVSRESDARDPSLDRRTEAGALGRTIPSSAIRADGWLVGQGRVSRPK
jgi:hypothetical protein